MGCFNSVIFRCPKCNKEIKVQSNAGSCLMKSFSPLKVPMPEAEDIINTTITCYECDSKYVSDGNFPRYATLFLIDPELEDEDGF